MKIFNCKTFSHCFNTIRVPSFNHSNPSLEVKEAIGILSEQLSDENHLLKLQKDLLKDPLFLDILDSYSGLSPDEQISKTNQYFIQAFSKLESSYFQDRLKDITDVCGMLKKIVLNISVVYPEEDCILYIEEITPYEILHLPANIKGLVIKNNSMQTHTSILLKEQNIPFVNSVDLSDNLYCSCLFYHQKLYINPTQKEINKYHEFVLKGSESVQKQVLINLSSLNFPKYPYDGIGLFRTEMHAIQLGYIPPEEEQYQYYKKLDIGKLVRIRLFDFGEDKRIDESQDRGFCYLKNHPEILTTQLKSILRCNCENFEILIPMVTSVEDVIFVKQLAQNICNEFGYLRVKIGCMIETPAAVFDLDRIIKEVDFINIGTNDLTKFTFATSRENPEYNENILTKIVSNIVRVAKENQIPYYICGEIGKDLFEKESI